MQSTSLAGRSILVVKDEPLIALDSTAFSHELARARRTPRWRCRSEAALAEFSSSG
jgi:hypothetical protein